MVWLLKPIIRVNPIKGVHIICVYIYILQIICNLLWLRLFAGRVGCPKHVGKIESGEVSIGDLVRKKWVIWMFLLGIRLNIYHQIVLGFMLPACCSCRAEAPYTISFGGYYLLLILSCMVFWYVLVLLTQLESYNCHTVNIWRCIPYVPRQFEQSFHRLPDGSTEEGLYVWLIWTLCGTLTRLKTTGLWLEVRIIKTFEVFCGSFVF